MNNKAEQIRRDFNKAKTTKRKVEVLGEFMFNHISHQLLGQGLMLKFTLALVALILGLVAVLVGMYALK